MDFSEKKQFRLALDGVLASDSFLRSQALGRLLSYLVERVLAGEAGSLKESVIGHELYGRPAGYDPKLDSVVRVSANRLRIRLEDYYRANPAERMRIVLPKGSYIPLLEFHDDKQTSDSPLQGVVGETPATVARRPASSRTILVVMVVLVLGMVSAGAIFWRHTLHSATASAGIDWSVRPFARIGGSQQFGALSPDGTRIAFTSTTTQDDRKQIYIQATASEEAHRVTAGERPSWSPDGTRIAFLRPEANGKKQVVLYNLATQAEAQLAELGDLGTWTCHISRLSWSADGKVLFTGATVGGNTACKLVAIDVASRQVRTFLEPQSLLGDMEPAVSPDGSTVAFQRALAVGSPDIFVVAAGGGEPRRITSDGADILGFDWSPDGKTLLVASNRETGTRRLWRVPVAGGAAQALTDGSSAPSFPSVSRNGREIGFTQFHVTASVWKSEAGKNIEILDNRSRNDAPGVSPDGKKLLYTSDRAGREQVWLSNADGSGSRPLLPDDTYETGSARWSPDGKQVVMECHLGKKTHICISNADGSGVHQLTDGDSSQVIPSWSHDGAMIYFTSTSAGQVNIYRIGAARGVVVPMTHLGGIRALESWDGKWLYVARGQPLGGMVALPLRGTEEERRAAEKTPLLPELTADTGTGWDVCKDGIVYFAHNHASPPRLNIFDMRTRTSRSFLALDGIDAETNLSIGVLPDSRGVVYAAARTQSELSMMSLRP